MQYAMGDQLSGSTKNFLMTSLLKNSKMTSSELESYELKRMQYNAFKVCEEAVSRVDGAPGPLRGLSQGI